MDYKVPKQFTFQGRIYVGAISPNISEDMCDGWKVKPTDIVVASFPKSGTTWMGAILDQLRQHHHLFKTDGNKDLRRTIPYIESTFPNFPRFLDSQDEFASPRIMKTHLQFDLLRTKVEKENLKVIVMMREPKDNLVSLYHFYKSKLFNFPGEFDDFMELVKEDQIFHGNVWQWVISWWEARHLRNVRFVSYEEMKKDPLSVIHGMGTFMGINIPCDIAEQISQATSFDSMKKRGFRFLDDTFDPEKEVGVSPVHFFRKGIIGDWENTMSKEQAEIIDERTRHYYIPAGLSCYL